MGDGDGLPPPPLRLPPLINGPVDSGSAVAAQTHGLCSGSCPGARGAWVLGCGSLRGALFPPLLPWPCAGLVFSCSGEICQISHHSFTSFLTHILHTGASARCITYSFKETVTWDPFLASPLGGGERYRLASVMIFPRPVYENSESSQIMLITYGDLRGL